MSMVCDRIYNASIWNQWYKGGSDEGYRMRHEEEEGSNDLGDRVNGLTFQNTHKLVKLADDVMISGRFDSAAL